LYFNKALFINKINENGNYPAGQNGDRSYYQGGEVDLIAECITFTLQLHKKLALKQNSHKYDLVRFNQSNPHSESPFRVKLAIQQIHVPQQD